MREAELLNALSQNGDGIVIYMIRKEVLVKTRYAPHSEGTGETLQQAAFKCAKHLLNTVRQYPSLAQHCPDVVDALEAYELHTAYLET